MKDVARQEHKKGTFRRRKLLGRFIARKLFRQLDKRYNQEYWGRLERNWRQWKSKQPRERKMMKTIEEKEEIKQENSGVKEWIKEDNNKMNNMVDSYYEQQKIPQDKET